MNLDGSWLLWAFAAALPWLVCGAFIRFGIRPLRPLPSLNQLSGGEGALPAVTVIVPARNEERSIERCLRSISLQDYPDFRIVVVDDRSSDRTAELARGIPAGNATAIEVVDGEPLPAGWFGKPWACAQGARHAEGDLLLFTDADTRHHPSLLRRTVAALHEDDARALSLFGEQELGSFGERLVQPQILALLGLRYRNLDRTLERGDPQEAIANGQYILVDHAAYWGVGGHDAVSGEVVEDLALARTLVAAGHRLTLREAEDAFSTRMYQALGEVVDGWTKNMAVGAQQSAEGWGGRGAALILPGILGFLVFWIAPAAALLVMGGWAWDTGAGSGWAAFATGIGLLTWGGVYRRFGVSRGFALLYPVAQVIIGWIALRSWIRGHRRIEWKGRRYGSS